MPEELPDQLSPDSNSSSLTEKQERFVRAWIGNGHDGSAAVRAAGYETTYPSSLASQILKSKAVKRRIAELEGLPPLVDVSKLTKADLLSKMAHIAFEDTQAKPADRIAALKALGADLGLFGGDQREDTGQGALVAALEAMRKMPARELEALIATFEKPQEAPGDPEADPEGLEL